MSEIVEIGKDSVSLTVVDNNITLDVTTSTVSLETASVGPQGIQGIQGLTGPSNVLSIGSVTSGTPASATITGTSPSQVLNLVLPKGDTGNTGPSNVLSIGTVTTGAAGSSAIATITGTSPSQILNLTIPRGDTGQIGPTGPGVPSGGAINQVLAKNSAIDYDTHWVDVDSLNVSATQVHAYVKNGSGQALTKGQVVYIFSASGANPLITLAQANSEATSSKTLGVLEQDLAVNAFGYVACEGQLTGLNTGAAQDGDPIWLSPTTAGGMIYGLANKPSAPNHLVFIGYVLRAQSQNGVIYVKPQNGFEFQELHNVEITNVTNGQTVAYDSVTSTWKNTNFPATGVTSITASPPLTGNTITSTGTIGLDQTALTLDQSQVTGLSTALNGKAAKGANSDITSLSGLTTALSVGQGGTGQTSIGLTTTWTTGVSYNPGDVVTSSSLIYYVCRVAHTSSGSITLSNTTYWAQRTASPGTLTASPITSLVPYITGSGIAAVGIGIGQPFAGLSVPASGLNVSNGSIAVSGSGNGISVASGNIIATSGSITAGLGITASGQLAAKSTVSTSPALIVNPQSSIATSSINAIPNITGSSITVTPASTTGFAVGQTVQISGVIGGNNVNGTFTISNVVVTNLVLINPSNNSSGTYISGGTITAFTTSNLQEWQSLNSTAVASISGTGVLTARTIQFTDSVNGNTTIVPAVGSGINRTLYLSSAGGNNSATLLTDYDNLSFSNLKVYVTQVTGSYTVTTESIIKINNSATATITLPTPSPAYTGKILKFIHQNAISCVASGFVVPLTSATAGTALFSSATAAGKWTELVCDGTNWLVVAQN